MAANSGDREWKLRARSLIQPTEDKNLRVHDDAGGLSEESDSDLLIADLQMSTGLSSLTLKVCVARGLVSPQAIQEFLMPRFDSLKNPNSIRDMNVAVDRLSQARQSQEKVRVFGDYDVDGTTGAALLSWIFRDFGLVFDVRQPDRFKDGYGLNVKAVEEAAEAGVRILLTVDCGISSFDAADRAKELGIELIIVDHHQIDPTRGLPQAVAVIDPQRSDCESGLKQVCGCGLAFYLAIALRARGRTEGWFAGGLEPNLKQHLDLVVMATAADMVPLLGDNHVLVRYGLDVLKHTKKPGVRALLEVAGLGSKTLSPSHLGFVLGPRINASGRIQSASLALELLTTLDSDRAFELAHELERLNQERAQLQNQIWDQVRVEVEKGIAAGKYRHGIAIADAGWHEGVIGIVASRVTETFRKPAAVISLREDFGKGSVRSYGGKDVLAALRVCAPFLKGFGGHKHAAGLSVELDQVEAFAEAFDHAFALIPDEATSSILYLEGSCSINDLTVRTIEELEKLGPFGPGNPEPVFYLRASIKDHRVLKGRHLKLNLASSESLGLSSDQALEKNSICFPKSSKPTEIEAIWFYGAERKEFQDGIIKSDEEREWAGVPELNRFRGRVTPTFRVRDWRQVEGFSHG